MSHADVVRSLVVTLVATSLALAQDPPPLEGPASEPEPPKVSAPRGREASVGSGDESRTDSAQQGPPGRADAGYPRSHGPFDAFEPAGSVPNRPTFPIVNVGHTSKRQCASRPGCSHEPELSFSV